MVGLVEAYPEPQVPVPAYLFPGGATYSCLHVAGSGFQRQSPVSRVAGSGPQTKVPPHVPVAGK